MDFAEEIARNKRQTAVVCLAMLLLMFGVVFAFGLLLGTPPVVTFPLAALLAVLYVGMAYSFSLDAVIRAAAARPARPDVREERLLMMRVEEIAIASGLPPPKVYIQDSKDLNAFATGRDPKEAVVCVTTGALATLDQEELQGVLAHEMSHILNRDILLSTVTVGVVGAIALLAEIALRALWWGGGRG
ncbi:MAG: M48 family metalloprotease, partial [Methanobacteriota archaeon]